MRDARTSAVTALILSSSLLYGSCGGSSSASSASAPAARWICFDSPSSSGSYCECGWMTDQQFEARALDVEPLSACPTSSHLCCGRYATGEAFSDVEACICWNPGSAVGCEGAVEVVATCPTPSTGAPIPEEPGWCCGPSGNVCLCRDDVNPPCEVTACPPTHTCCIAGSDPDGQYCTCYTDTYLSELSMTCEERAAPGEILVDHCPDP